MRETYMHIAGVVATDPTMRELDDGRQVVSFRVASTSRRYDTQTKEWVDGATLWVKVSCWRELAANASRSVRKRDRIVAWGRVRTEQWKGEDGTLRSDLALEAEAMGHDLTFGVSSFDRRSKTVSTKVLTDDGMVVDPLTGELKESKEVPVPSLPAQPAAGPAGPDDDSRSRAGDAVVPDGNDLDDDLDDLDDDEAVDVGDDDDAAGELTGARREGVLAPA